MTDPPIHSAASASYPNRRARLRPMRRCFFLAAFAAIGSLTARAGADTVAEWQTTNSDDWTTPTDWSTNPNYPNNGTPSGVTYSADVSATGSAYTIGLGSDVSVDALTLNSADATLNQTAGTLQANTVNLNSGTYAMNGGTFSTGTVNQNGGTLQINTGTLSNATIAGDDLNVGSGAVTIVNGLTVDDGNIDLTGGGSLIFADANPTFSNITIYSNPSSFGNPTNNIVAGGQSLTLGQNTSVQGSGFTFSGSSLINDGNIVAGTYTNIQTSTFVNNGNVSVGVSGTGYYYDGLSISSPWTNSLGATLSASGGTSLVISGVGTNAGAIQGANGAIVTMYGTNASTGSIAVDASTLILGDQYSGGDQPGTWSNAGTITAANSSSVYLGGTFATSDIGSLKASSDSVVVIQGTLNNQGATLTPANFGGSWVVGYTGTSEFSSAVIDGGTINLAGGSFYCQSGVFNGVRISGGDLELAYGFLDVQNGITVDTGNVYISASYYTYPGIAFDGRSQTVDNLNIHLDTDQRFAFGAGPASVSVGGFVSTTGPITLTLGKSGVIQGSGAIVQQFLGSTLVNQGLIDATMPSNDSFATNALEVDTTNFTNDATIEADGGVLTINSAKFINNGSTVITNGGSIVINSTNFTNSGNLRLQSGSTLTLPSSGMNVGQGTLGGSGTVTGNVTMDADPSTLSFLIGGTGMGSTYDSLTINGNMSLAGYLQLAFSNGFESSITSSEMFTVLIVGDGGMLTGSFANVADGGTLETSGGYGSFEVLYGSGQYADEIVLTDFQATPAPEPASAGLVLAAFGLLLRRRHRLATRMRR